MKAIVQPAAERDLEAAIGFYEEQSKGLGRSLALEFRACVERALHHPEANPRFDGEIRRGFLRRFPT